MIVLGMDGLDPVLLRRFMDDGKLPNFSALAQRGTFMPLETAMPPQSPVAWSNFISGARPDTHMIWDFIHRDPAPQHTTLPILPFQSTGDVQAIELPWYKELIKTVPWLGGTQLPVVATSTIESSRRGPAFWEDLVAGGVDTVIWRMPANYPPPAKVEGRGEFRCLCGMGTPDMRGSYGEFTSFRTDVAADRDLGGGRIRKLTLVNNRATGRLVGPDNGFKLAAWEAARERAKAEKRAFDEDKPTIDCPIAFVVDPEERTVKITVSDQDVVLREGDWSDWVTVTLDTQVPWLGGMFNPTALVRFKAIAVGDGTLNVYASPLQIDPSNPANPISTPEAWAGQIAAATGPYYTAGIPEDTKALTQNPQTLNEDQFLEMVENLARERRAQYAHALSEFRRGFLFYYFGHTDQLAHIFWRDIDPGHPGRVPEQDGKYDKVIENTYLEMDEHLGAALAVLDENDAIIVMSDHGFASFRRGFNVNTWLQREGYQQWFGRRASDRNLGLLNIDMRNTQAYAVGINSIYLNLVGREASGIVAPEQYDGLVQEIGEKLLAFRDDDGAQVVERVYHVREEFPELTTEEQRLAPDLLVGYARNYRGSWATTLGGMRGKIVEDNLERWSGDHCIAHHLVPGTLVTNLRVSVEDPALSDLAPSILALWGVPADPEMIGRRIFERPIPAGS